MDNLVEIIPCDYSDKTDTWIDIPYPSGFNKFNSDIIIQSYGTEANNNVTFKINHNRTQYSAIGINNYSSYVPRFIFIKTNKMI